MQGGQSDDDVPLFQFPNDDDVPLFQFPNDDDVPLFSNNWVMKRKREEEAELRLRSEAAIAQRNNLGNERLKLRKYDTLNLI
jgi:hypothetical protein